MSLLTDLLNKIRPAKNYPADELPVQGISDNEPESPLSGFTGALKAQKAKAAPNKKLLICIPLIIAALAVSYWIYADKPSGKLSLGKLPVGKNPAPPRLSPAAPPRSAPVPGGMQDSFSPLPSTVLERSEGKGMAVVAPSHNVPPLPAAPEPAIPPAPTVTSPAAKHSTRPVISKRAEKEEVKDPEGQTSPFILEDPFSQESTSIRNLEAILKESKLKLDIAKNNAEIKKLMVQEEPPPVPGAALSMPPLDEGELFGDDIWVKGIARSAYGELSVVLESNTGRWVVREGDIVDNRWEVRAIQDNKVILQRKGSKEKKELLLGSRLAPSGGMERMGSMLPPQMEQERMGGSRRQAQ